MILIKIYSHLNTSTNNIKEYSNNTIQSTSIFMEEANDM